jgi:hypothetical protein
MLKFIFFTKQNSTNKLMALIVFFEFFVLLIQESCDGKCEDIFKVAKHPDLTLRGTPVTGCHPDPASGQTPLFGRAVEAYIARCVCVRFKLIHIDPRRINSVLEARGIKNDSKHQGELAREARIERTSRGDVKGLWETSGCLETVDFQRREREGGEDARRSGCPRARRWVYRSLHQELAGDLATYASLIKSKGGSDEKPAGAPGVRFLTLAISSLGMELRR